MRIGRLDLRHEGVTVQLSRLQLERRPGRPWALSIDRIAGPAGMLPLWASLRLAPKPAGWDVTGVVASGKGELVVRLDAAGLGGSTPRLELRTEPVQLAPDGLQPASLWPPLGRVLRDAQGSLGLTVRWQGGAAPVSGASLAIDGLRAVTDYGPVGPVDGTIALDRLWPPRTATPQTLRVAGLQLAQLVDGFAIEALGADGTIDADLRFSFTEDGRLFIDEGRLAARGPGLLRYRPAQPPAALAGQGAGVELLMAALADFRYAALSAIVKGHADAELSVAIRLRGANPALYEGHPIELNLDLEAPILPLVGAGRRALELPQAVRRALEKRQR